jgi:outer membrane immunogenic protein
LLQCSNTVALKHVFVAFAFAFSSLPAHSRSVERRSKPQTRAKWGKYHMRKITVLLAAVAALASAPAMAAGEGRVEARGGLVWANGAEEAIAGVAVGYDFDLGSAAFVGVEGAGDIALADGAEVVWSVGARAGGKVSEKGKLYVNAGLGFCCGSEEFYAGAGYQHKFGQNLYGKIEYRRIFGDIEANVAQVGIGFAF